MPAKRLKIIDEQGMKWTFVEGDSIFDTLRKIRLDTDELACFRDHIYLGLDDPVNLEEIRSKVDTLTNECIETREADDDLLDRLVHASKAFVTATEIQRVLESARHSSIAADKRAAKENKDTQGRKDTSR